MFLSPKLFGKLTSKFSKNIRTLAIYAKQNSDYLISTSGYNRLNDMVSDLSC